MDYSSKNTYILQVQILCFLLLLQSVRTEENNLSLIYNQCSNRTSLNPSHSSLLSTLFQEFITRSSKSKFFETIVADEKTAISGSFQCRQDLSPDECKSCVSKIHSLSADLCGNTLPSRIQLSGCYLNYQEDEDESNDYVSRPDDRVLHRECSKHRIKKSGFEETKLAAFSAVENGVIISGNGFYETNYESMHVLAQCDGSLGVCDCGECVSNAVLVDGEDECRYSVSGEVYLQKCFIRYKFYGGGRGYGGYSFGENGIGERLPKLVAIVIGGLAAILLGLAFCYFVTSCGKKKDDW